MKARSRVRCAESYEEANITPEDIEVVGSYREDHGPWAYTTVFAFEKPGHRVVPRANDDESMEIEWVPIDEVPDRKLLTAMRNRLAAASPSACARWPLPHGVRDGYCSCAKRW